MAPSIAEMKARYHSAQLVASMAQQTPIIKSATPRLRNAALSLKAPASMSFPRHHRLLTLVAAIALTTSVGLTQGILPGDRWPVKGIPRICGREIPQFILFNDTEVQRTDERWGKRYAIPKGLFIPVSQDKDSVFYHAINGVVEFDFTYRRFLVPGGLAADKTRPNQISVYFGDARKPGAVLRPIHTLRTEVLEKIRISQPVK